MKIFAIAVIIAVSFLYFYNGGDSELSYLDYTIIALLLYILRIQGFSVLTEGSFRTQSLKVLIGVSSAVLISLVLLLFKNHNYIVFFGLMSLAIGWTSSIIKEAIIGENTSEETINKPKIWLFLLIQLNGVFLINSERILSTTSAESLLIFKQYWPLLLASTAITLYTTSAILSLPNSKLHQFISIRLIGIIAGVFVVIGALLLIANTVSIRESSLRIAFVATETLYGLFVATCFKASRFNTAAISSSLSVLIIMYFGPLNELLLAASFTKVAVVYYFDIRRYVGEKMVTKYSD